MCTDRSYFDFHLLLISCPVPAGVVSLCRNTLVNAGPLPACPSLALMTWEVAAIPCSHVFNPMFAGWLSTSARKVRNIILCRKLPALGWQGAANVDPKMHRWGMMTYGSLEWRPPFSDEEWEQRNMRRNCRLLRSPSPSRPPGLLCVCTVFLWAARGGFAFVISWFQRVHEHRPFDVRRISIYVRLFRFLLLKKKNRRSCLCFLHRRALACTASELRFRLAYFNF